MYTRMLIALDGSKTAENVLPYARSLAKVLKIPVQLIGVIEISHYTSDARASYLDSLIDAAIRRNQEYLQRVAKTFPSASVGWTVEGGVPEEIIITKAAEDRGTFIAMATHGRSGFNRWLLGSVAEKVLREQGTPCCWCEGSKRLTLKAKWRRTELLSPLTALS